MGTQGTGPKVLLPLPLGVSAETGRPLSSITSREIALLSTATESQARSEQVARNRHVGVFALTAEAGDANELADSGWGVVFPKNVDNQVVEALAPLIEHRKKSATPFAIFRGEDGYLPNDTARDWVERKGSGMGVVDPSHGVPFYLLLVGSPGEIPFRFQYDLDVFWAVGRIQFETPDEYRQYAESVVAYETATKVNQTRRIALFATQHDFDAATNMFVQQVATPMSNPAGSYGAIGSKYKFGLNPFVGNVATKQQLADILSGKSESGRPALLFTGSHGMSFKAGDPRQASCQGALVCGDWQGYGRIDENSWFEASDIPGDASFHGLITFMFACYSAGYPQRDDFDELSQEPRTIASAPSLSRLPQALLAHRNGGALAVLGHIDRAWAHSFVNSRGRSQPDGFRDVISRICRGDRIGNATDTFNTKWGALSGELLDCLKARDRGVSVSDDDIATLWVARNDARNYIIIGDPAVRLRTADISSLALP